jgi:hypothetical protein
MNILLKNILLEILRENFDIPVILGSIKPNMQVVSVKGNTEFERHPFDMRADSKWRYYPEIQQLDWWVMPTDKQHELVKTHLKDWGYDVRRVHYLTAPVMNEDMV